MQLARNTCDNKNGEMERGQRPVTDGLILT